MSDTKDNLEVLEFSPEELGVDEDFLVDGVNILEEIVDGIESGDVVGLGYFYVQKGNVVIGFVTDGDRCDYHHMVSGASILHAQALDNIRRREL